MSVDFVEFEAAREMRGLRMVVVTGVPSPWGEAAKGILHVKQIPWVAVPLDTRNAELVDWIGTRSGPAVVYEDEAPRSGWAEILLLAERIAPTPALLPKDPEDRALVFGLSHEICGEMGLGWLGRLAGVKAGLEAEGKAGFPKPVARYLADKYGYREESAAAITPGVVQLLEMLSKRLHARRAAGERTYVGHELSAVDIYSATFMALFAPLPREVCAMPEAMRNAFSAADDATREAVDPILLEHRDFMYREHLELPLTLT